MIRSKLSSKMVLLASGIGLSIATFAGSQPAAAQSYICPAGTVYNPTYGCTPGWGYGYAPYAYDYGYYASVPYGGYGWHHDYDHDHDGHGWGHGMGGGFGHGGGGGHH